MCVTVYTINVKMYVMRTIMEEHFYNIESIGYASDYVYIKLDSFTLVSSVLGNHQFSQKEGKIFSAR